MANFYWRGTRRDQVIGITAFDFNEPSNWMEFYETPVNDDGGCRPFVRPGGGIVQYQIPVRGKGIDQYNWDDEGSGWGWDDPTSDGYHDTHLCRTYFDALRAPGPGDVVIVGDDVAMALSPLLFGGFSGDSSGGVWLNGAYTDPNDPSAGYTHASGTTYNSSLVAFYYGGMVSGHPDFNYPWQRVGGGFTANSEKYAEYQVPDCEKAGTQIWQIFFGGGTVMGNDGVVRTVGNAAFPGATWSSGELTTRTQSLNIKSDFIQEAVRSYTGIPAFADIKIVKNLKQYLDDATGNVFDGVATAYERYSRNITSWVSGHISSIFNKPAEALADWSGVISADAIHDTYYMTPAERLVLSGVTAASLQSYVSDQVTLKSDSAIASVHFDDVFTHPEDVKYCLVPGTKHEICGKVNKDEVLVQLGLTGTGIGDSLDSTILISASHSSFYDPTQTLPPGSFDVWIGNNTGSTGITCDIKNVEINITNPSGPQMDEIIRPAKIKFTGTAPVVIDQLKASWSAITAERIIPSTIVSIGSLVMGRQCWLYPNSNTFSNWYFGTRNSATPYIFNGGIQFTTEGTLSGTENTCVLSLSPTMRIFNPLIGLSGPSQYIPIGGNGASIVSYIKGRNPTL
jgi:hypothetical protein